MTESWKSLQVQFELTFSISESRNVAKPQITTCKQFLILRSYDQFGKNVKSLFIMSLSNFLNYEFSKLEQESKARIVM